MWKNTKYFQMLFSILFFRPSEWTEKATQLRRVVTDVVPIDVHCSQPLAPDVLPPSGADCLVSCFCLESVSPDLPTFTRALGHTRKLLRPGGHLLLIGALGESYYFAGPDVRIPVVPLDEAQVCASLKESGYTLIRLEVYTLPPDMRVGVDDVTGVFFLKAVNQWVGEIEKKKKCFCVTLSHVFVFCTMSNVKNITKSHKLISNSLFSRDSECLSLKLPCIAKAL